MTAITQAMLDKAAAKIVLDYLSKIFDAPFKSTRIMSIQIDAGWQIERKFVSNMKRVNQLASLAPGLKAPFDPNEVTDHEDRGQEPGLLEEG